MDDQPRQMPETDDSANPTAAAPDADEPEAIELPGPAEETSSETGRNRPEVQQMVAQLQQMIDQLTTQASPALREVAAKAAELASAAAQRAGPIAHRAAAMTDSVGQRVAERTSRVATDLRSTPRAAADPDPAKPADPDTSDMPSGAVPGDDAA